MEPAATASLHDGLDLTVDHFEAIGWFGTPGPCGVAAVEGVSGASTAFLRPPYPNPTAAGAMVEFRISRPEYVRLSIVDVTGRAIRTLHEGMMPPGQHAMSWDGLTRAGVDANSGVYLVSLRTSEGVQTRRVAVSR